MECLNQTASLARSLLSFTGGSSVAAFLCESVISDEAIEVSLLVSPGSSGA